MNEPVAATVTGEAYKDFNPEKEDYLHFLLRDKVHSFTIGLSDILQCLKFAEEEGEVPELPALWWSQITSIYPKLEQLLELDILDTEDNDSI